MTPLDPIWGEVRGRLVPGWDRGDRCRPWPPGADAEDGLRSGRGNNKSFCPGRRRRLREQRKCRMTSPDLGHLSRRSSRRRGYRSMSPPLKSREATPLSTSLSRLLSYLLPTRHAGLQSGRCRWRLRKREMRLSSCQCHRSLIWNSVGAPPAFFRRELTATSRRGASPNWGTPIRI